MRGTVVAAVTLAVVAAGGSAGAAPETGHCYIRVLSEPSHTRGRSNTIRWDTLPSDCWLSGSETADGKKSTERRFVVTITNTASGAKDTVTVHGADKVQATVGVDDFPAGGVDGQRFSYLVTRKEKWCSTHSVIPGVGCEDYSTSHHDAPTTVYSTQDDRPPTGSLRLADGRTYVRSLDVPAAVTASDPGTNASGPGYVAFGPAGRCGPITGCSAEPLHPGLGAGLTVRLEPGPDGIRTVEGRVYDRARGPADDPGPTTIGAPPGNVSAPFQDTIFVDRTPPAIFIRISTMRIMVGSPVTFDASQSVDVPEGSGLQPATGEWSFGDGGRGTGLVVTRTYTRTGRFPFTFSVADNVGNVARTEPVEIEVTAAPVPPQPGTTEKPPQAPPPAAVDRTPPVLSALALTRRGGRTTVSFRLAERGTVRVEVKRVRPRPVRRTAALSRRLGAGRRGIALPAAATAKPGGYVIVLVARDLAGNVSKPKTLRLTTR